MTFRPHAGFRSAWIHQRAVASYAGNVVVPGGTSQFQVNLKNNYWGLGPRAGVNGEWGAKMGFSVYADLALALLLGHFSIFEGQKPTITNGSINYFSAVSFHEKFRAARMAYDLAMGVRWSRIFENQSYGLMLQLGWEQHLFPNQNQLQRISAVPGANGPLNTTDPDSFSLTTITNQGDLSTQGVTFTVQFDF